jgi:gamma-glutamyltranspeptidase/glutathione hydrolase
MSVLERGGNAFDAAVAAGFVLQVAEPHLCGPGGDVPILLYSARERATRVVCGQGPAPAAATIARFHSLGLTHIPGSGPLAACVPGAFGAWMCLLREYGTWTVGAVLEYAIGYARRGVPVAPRLAETLSDIAPTFTQFWPSSAQVYLQGARPRAGAIVRNEALARTYTRIVEYAQASGQHREQQIDAALHAFYRGFVADAIDDFFSQPIPTADGRRDRGLVTGDDLAGWAASIEAPVTFEYRGRTVCKPGPWSQGPVLLQQLAILEGYDLVGMGHLSPEWIHTVVETAKLAFADREAWYGDPEFADVPMASLLDPEYSITRRRLVDDQANEALRPGYPQQRTPRLPKGWEAVPASAPGPGWGEPATAGRLGRGDTCHVDVVDRHGNMVAAMPSGGWLQSSPVVPGLGFPLGTRAQMFWLDADHPNGLEPGKRPRTTLSPSLVLQDGEPVLAFGSPGGDFQDQWGLLFLLAVVDHGLEPQAAIESPAFNTRHLIDSFYPRSFEANLLEIENRVPAATTRELTRRGHRVLRVGPWSLGWLCAVGRDIRTGLLMAASNPRDGQAFAAGR